MIDYRNLNSNRKIVRIYSKVLLLIIILSALISCKEDSEELVAEFSIDIQEVDFGEIEILKQQEFQLSITNVGDDDLILKNFNITGTEADQFAIELGDEMGNITANTSYEFSVIFRPDQIGQKTAVVTISTNVGNHEIPLKGIAIAEQKGILSIGPEYKDFGEVEVNSSTSALFTITNIGNSEIVFFRNSFRR